MAQVIEYSVEKIKDTLISVEGDVAAAAEILDVNPHALSQRIYKVKSLRTLFLKEIAECDEVIPDDIDQMMRDGPNTRGLMAPNAEEKTIDAIRMQNLDIMTGGLQRAGISEKTLEKLCTLGSIETGAGQFLVGSLDIMHRMVVYSSVTLMEEAEHIRDTYLNDPKLKMAQRIEWQRAYNQLVDLMGKSYDRVLTGTQAMVKLSKKKGDDNNKSTKPAFKPLTQLKDGVKKHKKIE